NDWRYLVLLLSLFRIGGVACPLNNRIPPRGLQGHLETIACSKIVSSGMRFSAILPGTISLDLDDLVGQEQSGQEHCPEDAIPLERPATTVITSGSSGKPKAALLTYGNLFYNAKGSSLNIHLEPGDRWLLNLPLYHVGGLGILFRCLINGAAVVMPEPDEGLETSIFRHNVTHLSVVPTQLFRLLRDLENVKRLLSLKAVLVGGAPIPAPWLKKTFDKGLPVYTSYGLTEMSSQVTTTRADAPNEKRFTSGMTLRYAQLRIGPKSEILVRGETLFLGYVEGDQVRLPVDSEGWFATGDLGRLDADGYLTVLGRKDNMFISGGENIQPEEIEAALVELPSVAQALVVPVSDEEFGHRPVAFIRSTKTVIDPHAIKQMLRDLLPSCKVPIVFYDLSLDTEELKLDRSSYKRLAAELRNKSEKGFP
ncbi:MAG: o-succinylbenzoate--CoA ligase, partial [Candidatus Binatia bacterium]|nr:o-succinylbenzoate--CoA ligase [Candidatus Binatia bacterium]